MFPDYTESYKCPKCQESFLLRIPSYIIVFNRELAEKASKAHDVQKLAHVLSHMDKLVFIA